MVCSCRLAASILGVLGALLTPACVQAAVEPLELISAGQATGGNGPYDACDLSIQCLDFDASADGARAYFATAERLAATDTDASKDVYLHTTAGTTQVSTGLPGGNGNFDATLQDISSDGARVLFATFEALTRDDLDLTSDVYQRSTEVRLVSTGAASGSLQVDACDAETPSALACLGLAAGSSGNPVFFTTPESLTFDDLDSGCVFAPEHCLDVYRRSGDATTLVSAGTTGAEGAALLAVSRDGARAFFSTRAALAPGDGDAALDLYEASGTTLRLVSAGAGPVAVNEDVVSDVRVSANGSHVVFASAEPLVPADTDSAVDVYERAGGVTTLVSAGPGTGNGPHDACARFEGCPGLAVSDDGARVVFETADPLVAADTDEAVDVYERVDGVVRLISVGGSGGQPAFLDSISADGGRVLFSTAERLATADADGAVDVYERAGATTTLVSRGTQNGNGAAPAAAEGVSTDGSRVVFSTAEALLPTDTDAAPDLYARAAGVTQLVSGGTQNAGATFLDMSDDGGRVFFATAERLVAADADSRIDVYAAGVSSTVPPAEEPPVEEPPVEQPPVEQPPGGSAPGRAVQGAVPPPAAAGPASARTVARVTAVFGGRAKATRAGVVALKVRCRGSSACRGRARLESTSRRSLGARRFTARAGEARTIRVRLSRPARRLLARTRRVRASVRLQTLDASGRVVSSQVRRVTISS